MTINVKDTRAAGAGDGRWRARAIAAGEPGMTVAVRAPSPALAPFVEWIAYYEMAPSPGWRELVLPTGTMLLFVNLAEREFRWWDGRALAAAHARPGAMLVGASAGPFVIGGAERVRAALVSFRPGGGAPAGGRSGRRGRGGDARPWHARGRGGRPGRLD